MSKLHKIPLTFILVLVLLLVSQAISAKSFKISPLIKSVLVPGWGQLSLDRNYGYAMLTTEVVFWSTLFYNTNEQDLTHQESYEYALKFAHINPGSYASQYYRDLAKYDTSGFEAGGYNSMVMQTALSMTNLTPEQQQEYIDENAIPDEMAWQWDSYQQRKQFSSMRKDILELKDKAQLITGLLIANHIISSIDMLRLKKHWGNVHPSVQYYRNTPVLNLSVEF